MTSRDMPNEMNVTINTIYRDRFSELNALCETYYDHSGSTRQKNLVFNQLSDTIESIKGDNKRLKEMEEAVNNYRNNLMMLDNNLSKTFALKAFREGKSSKRAAKIGYRKAHRRIFTRKCLDWMSAIVYLLTFRIKNFSSVVKAHKEYKRLRQDIGREEVRNYLSSVKPEVTVAGIYRKSIIVQSMLKGKSIFGSIHEADFYKI